MLLHFGRKTKMELFDTHSHYNDGQFDIDREEVIKSVYKAGVTRLAVVRG